MKAARFRYVKARALAEVFETLAREGDDARILAGGQSLLPTLAMRLSEPSVLVDINGLEFGGIAEDDGGVRIGALVRHAEIGRSALVAERLPLPAEAVPHIAHPAIRNRGTFGGSLALADPAAEWPAVVMAMGGTILLAGPRGERGVPANRFFTGLYETARAPDEVVLGAVLPARRPGERAAFRELARRRGDYAIVGLAAQGQFDAGGAASALSLVFLGVGLTPIAATNAAAASIGGPLDERRIAAAAEALGRDLDPPADLHGSGATKLHLARVLLTRTLRDLAGHGVSRKAA